VSDTQNGIRTAPSPLSIPIISPELSTAY
jgi:hypothetical protein